MDGSTEAAAPAAPASAASPLSATTNGTNGSNGKSPLFSSLAGQSGDRARMDHRGVTINNADKKHKVAFIDEVKPKSLLHEVREVKSYKNNNMGCRCVMM